MMSQEQGRLLAPTKIQVINNVRTLSYQLFRKKYWNNAMCEHESNILTIKPRCKMQISSSPPPGVR